MTEKPPSPDRSGHVQVEDGTRQIYWEYFGQGEKEVVVLLNGLAMLTRSWHRTVPILNPEFDVLLYDYFGQGQSSQQDEPYYIHKFAEYLVGVMDALSIERVHPIGVSYGGFIAADLGRLFQDRLHTLVLSGILLTHEIQFQMYQDISLMFYRHDDQTFDIYTHYLYEKIFSEKFAQRIYGEKMEKGRRNFYDRYRDQRYCLIRLTEAQNPFFENIQQDETAYRDIQTPTLIFTGEEDRAIPPWQQRKLLDILPNSRQIMLPECGHMTYMEKPEIFWPSLKAFFAVKSIEFDL